MRRIGNSGEKGNPEMRKIEKAYQIAVQSIAEIQVEVDYERNRIAAELGLRVEIGGRSNSPSVSHLINYLLCDYLTERPEEQDRRILRGKQTFDAHCAHDRPVRFGCTDIAPAEPSSARVHKKKGA